MDNESYEDQLLDLIEPYMHKVDSAEFLNVPLLDLSSRGLAALVLFLDDEMARRHKQYLADIRDVHNLYTEAQYESAYDDYTGVFEDLEDLEDYEDWD